MDKNISTLIERVIKSDLSEDDKSILIEKLNKDEPDILGFTNALVAIFKVGKEILKLFDIDTGIGDD